MFRALLIDKANDQFSSQIVEIDNEELPEGDVLIDVEHSTVNLSLIHI